MSEPIRSEDSSAEPSGAEPSGAEPGGAEPSSLVNPEFIKLYYKISHITLQC